MPDVLWLPLGFVGGIVLASALWIAMGWLYEHQPKWLERYMVWLNRKAGLDTDALAVYQRVRHSGGDAEPTLYDPDTGTHEA